MGLLKGAADTKGEGERKGKSAALLVTPPSPVKGGGPPATPVPRQWSPEELKTRNKELKGRK